MKTPWRALGVGMLLASTLATAQVARPTLAPSPLEFDPHPAVKRVEGPLRQAWTEVLRDKAGVIVPSRKELEAAQAQTRRQDCRESNECLALLAQRAGTLYAVYAYLAYDARKQLVLTGRVVRDDGKLMGAGGVELPRGKDGMVQVFRLLLLQLVDQLGLRTLPTFKEAPKVEAPPVERAPEPQPERPLALPPPPLATPPEPVANPLRVAAYVGTGVGVAVGAVGVVLFALSPFTRVGTNVPVEQKDNLAGNRAGVGLMIAGGALAAAGAVAWALTPELTTRVGVLPLAGGGVVAVGGTFP